MAGLLIIEGGVTGDRVPNFDVMSLVGELYPPPTLKEHQMYSIGFVDPHPAMGQTYPGFVVTPPDLQ